MKTIISAITKHDHRFTSHKNHSNHAFTLAEVLITLAIIGVVAAITIPTVAKKYEEQKTVTQLLKVYSTLSRAWQMMQFEYGTFDHWGLTNTNTGLINEETQETIYDHSAQSLISARLRKYLKVSRVCKMGEICYPYRRVYLNGQISDVPKPETGSNDSPPDAKFYLSDGTYIIFGWYGVLNGSPYMDFSVTLPGNKRILGRTEFYFSGNKKGILPEDNFTQCNPNYSGQAGRGCTAWVLNYKNMDYLHCYEKLKSESKHSCKE